MTTASPAVLRLRPRPGRGGARRPRLAPATVITTVAVTTFAVRLAVLLRGGGVLGLGNYDDGVYFSASMGFVHGLLPYRDFLLLHPPGVVLALAPFAAAARVVGDADAFAAARVAWMVLGAVNAVLVAAVLRRRGHRAALLGGLFYAWFWPAAYSDHTAELETLGTALTLGALLLLTDPTRRGRRVVVVAGSLLGAAAGVKIWAALAVVVVAAWIALSERLRTAAAFLLGAVGGASVVCLPFFLAAPGAMWRMVVLDQLGRPHTRSGPVSRVLAIVGQGVPTSAVAHRWVLVMALVLLLAAATALTVPGLRVVLVVGLSSAVLLMLTPSWFPHYASLLAGPGAVAVGAGLDCWVRSLSARRAGLGRAVAVAAFALVAAYGLPLVQAHVGRSFPGARLGAAVAGTPTCVTADDPTTLVLMGVLGRDLDLGCPFVVDLGGWTYDHPTVPAVARDHNTPFQAYALRYLGSGGAAVSVRFRSGAGFSPATAREVGHWPVLAESGGVALRRPRPPG